MMFKSLFIRVLLAALSGFSLHTIAMESVADEVEKTIRQVFEAKEAYLDSAIKIVEESEVDSLTAFAEELLIVDNKANININNNNNIKRIKNNIVDLLQDAQSQNRDFIDAVFDQFIRFNKKAHN